MAVRVCSRVLHYRSLSYKNFYAGKIILQKLNMREILQAFKRFINYRFNLHEDSAEESQTVDSIKKSVEFKGANLWTLIFAIFIASIGLNVNSTAVIIGAMLVSPLMGPIMGIGLGVAINDFDLVKKALRNLGIATVISIITSSLYFYITPLHDASSELLARTLPSIWDVFIAIFGGLAGVIAATRKEKNNVIPGVAIATALMPPLCTAGYGIASGNFYFFLGATYLYFINSVFICTSTYLIVRYLHFKKIKLEHEERRKKVRLYMWFIVVVTAAPSIYLAYRIVDRSIFENNADNFIRKEINFTNVQVVKKTFNYSRHGSEIDLLLIGEHLDTLEINKLEKKLPDYRLGNAKLKIKQGLTADSKLDPAKIHASILQSIYQAGSEKETTSLSNLPDLKEEMNILYPFVESYAINKMVFYHAKNRENDTSLVAIIKGKKIGQQERVKLQRWLKTRLKVDALSLIVK